MTVRDRANPLKRDPSRGSPHPDWFLVAALITVAVVIIATIIVTKSAEAAAAVVAPLVLLVGYAYPRQD